MRGARTLLLLMLFFAACKSGDARPTLTPPIVPVTKEAAPTATLTAAGVVSPTPTAVPMPTAPGTTATPIPTSPPSPTAAPPTSTPLPVAPVTHVQLSPVVTGLFKPVYLTHAFDERLFVVEQSGVIRIIERSTLLPQPFLDIQDRVGSAAPEQGLLSVAFHPNYAQPGQPGYGRFFVNYTNKAGDTIIARYEVEGDDPNRARPDSEVVLLTIPQPFPNHNGGQLQFGPDGYLYVGVGDGGSANDPQGNGQNPATLLGSLLRLDVTHEVAAGYAIPASNPFVNDDGRRNEIWAFGLRNPWRFSFDRLTGALYIADVGQNLWEEVHVQPGDSAGGENYGWNIMEGTHCFQTESCDPDGLQLPVAEYGHNEGCSITGGYVYRGRQFPELYGNYFYGDYCFGTIWSLVQFDDGRWLSTRIFQGGLNISSFGESADGEIYVLDHAGGRVLQLTP